MELQLIHLRNSTCCLSLFVIQKSVAIWATRSQLPIKQRWEKSTIDEMVIEVCEEINSLISPRAVKIGSTAEVTMRFEQMGFLNCASTTDQTHILVLYL